MVSGINLKFIKMKLLSKINWSYFKYGILIFLLADVIIVILINFILKLEIDQQLELEANEIMVTITNKGNFQDIYPTAVAKVLDTKVQFDPFVKDTVIYDVIQDKFVPFREYSETATIAGKNYQIITRHMLMEFDDFFILYTTLISTVLLFTFFGLFVFTRRFNTRIWGTFNNNIKSLRTYSFDPPSKLNLAQTGIDEFDELNLALSKMSDRLEKDYTASREFSASAAHEIQTPLAIIRNKCETLFSNPGLSDETISPLRDIYLSADKLSGTLKALLLLAKIDHGQFNENNLISFNELIKNTIRWNEFSRRKQEEKEKGYVGRIQESGHFFRRGKIGSGVIELPEEIKNDIISKYGKFCEKLGYRL